MAKFERRDSRGRGENRVASVPSLDDETPPFSASDVFEAGSLVSALALLVFRHPSVLALKSAAQASSESTNYLFEDSAGLIGVCFGHNEPLLPIRHFSIDHEPDANPLTWKDLEEDDDVDRVFFRPPPIEIQNCYDAINLRAGTLFEILQKNQVTALGHTVDGHLVRIAHAIWSHEDYYIDPYAGDIYEAGPQKMIKRWTAVVFQALQQDQIDRLEQPPVSVERGTQKVTSNRARIECLGWLTAEMRKSPNERLLTKGEWWAQARRKWPDKLSQRLFGMIWARAAEDAGARAWTIPGAPRKKRAKYRRNN